MALELLLSDHAGECVAPCAAQCPAGLDIPGFVYEIAAGDNRRSMEVIADRLALPGALGRICPRLCEQQCRRCDHDQGLAIGALHRYAADLDWRAAEPYVPPRAPASGKSVAIVGAGPAGLAAAYFLRQKGHACTLFDAASAPGGMLRYGIPAYRLPKDALDAEIQVIRKLGAEFRMGMRWGEHFTLAELWKSHDAVFLAIGAQRAQGLRCEGEELALSGIEFLELVAKGNPPSLGEDVIVVGGGNTAMDCARSAVRLDARAVKILYRRTRQEMPCLMEEVEAAEAEGVNIELLVSPTRLERNGSHRLLLTCQRMELGEPDESGRRRPVPVDGSEFYVECSTVIAAIGQAVERSLAEREGLRVTGWGIDADEKTLATNLPGVFAGGDAVLGADLAVRAVAAGRIAAASIDQFLKGEAVTGEPAMIDIAMRPVDDGERAAIFRAIEKAARVHMPEIDMRAPTGELRRGLERIVRSGRPTGGPSLPDLRLPQSRLLQGSLSGDRIRCRCVPLRRRAPPVLAGRLPPGDHLRAGQVHHVRRLRAHRCRGRRGPRRQHHRPRLRRDGCGAVREAAVGGPSRGGAAFCRGVPERRSGTADSPVVRLERLHPAWLGLCSYRTFEVRGNSIPCCALRQQSSTCSLSSQS